MGNQNGYLGPLLALGEHHNHRRLLVPHHLPEVIHSLLQGAWKGRGRGGRGIGGVDT